MIQKSIFSVYVHNEPKRYLYLCDNVYRVFCFYEHFEIKEGTNQKEDSPTYNYHPNSPVYTISYIGNEKPALQLMHRTI